MPRQQVIYNILVWLSSTKAMFKTTWQNYIGQYSASEKLHAGHGHWASCVTQWQ